MDSATFIEAVAAGLGDSANVIYSSGALQQAMIRAVHAYSQFLPNMRRMGTGNLLVAAGVGESQFVAAGGWFGAGDTLVLDPFTPSAESVVVQSVARYVAEGSEPAVVPYVQVTLESALGLAHLENAVVSELAPGLALRAGQDTYSLPYDFRSPDQDSFDMATGQKMSYHATNAFYDASSAISRALSGSFFGQSTNFGTGSGSGYPLAGNIGDNPNGLPGGAGSALGKPEHYRFLLSDTPQLVVSPAPGGSYLLDFYYWGCHTIDTVPSVDGEAVLQYAIYAAVSSRIGTLSGLIDLRMADGEESQPSKMVAGLKEAAAAALGEFDRLVRVRPFGVSG